MIDLNKIYHVYLIGIGGIGMSALARYFHAQRIAVAGYDLTSSPLTKELEDIGIDIHYHEAIEHIPPKITQEKLYSLVIYTPAIPNNHKELVWLKDEGCTVMKRSEALGLISKQYKTIAVSGTHGKTTTSSMIAHVMSQSNVGINAFLGGISTNLNSNLVLNKNAEYAVIEADEFDRSFLTLYPTYAITTSVEADHLDVYGEEEKLKESFQLFTNQVANEGKVFHQKNVSLDHNNIVKYGIRDKELDFSAENIHVDKGDFIFDAHTPTEKIESIKLGINGLHNIENAIACIAVCKEIGLDSDTIKSGLESYQGVKRRFEYLIKSKELIFIDDYAHHPSEIKALIDSVRELYPKKRITGIFQPHLYSRTKDFADDFAKELSKIDEVLLLEIYPARELPLEGVSSQMLLDKITTKKELVRKEELNKVVTELNPEIVLTIGAGDIDRLVNSLKESLLEANEIKI